MARIHTFTITKVVDILLDYLGYAATDRILERSTFKILQGNIVQLTVKEEEE